MKDDIIFYSIIVCSLIATICFIYKLLLWLKLDPNGRIGFITSFVAFFTVHDVHNASTPAGKKFRKKNNLLNALFWVALLGLAVVFVFNTSDSNSIIPSKYERLKEKKGF